MSSSRPHLARVVLVDGHCLLCQAWVRFLLRHDRRARLRFAPLQSEVAIRELRDRGVEPPQLEAWLRLGMPESEPGAGGTGAGPGSVIYLTSGRIHRRSGAALRILRDLGPPWALAAVFLAVPAPLRDAVYDLVARYRYRWFGRSETCMVPPDRYRDRFLEDPAAPAGGKEPSS